MESPRPRHDIEAELLVIRCQLGQTGAFDDLIARWSEPLYGHARRLLGDDDAARDMVQDVWIRVLRGLHRLQDPANFRAWLYGIAHRAFADLLRTRYRQRDSEPLDESAIEPSVLPADSVETAILLRMLAQLAPTEREILTLFHLQELSLAEVSVALGVPLGTVKSRLARARAALRRKLETASHE